MNKRQALLLYHIKEREEDILKITKECVLKSGIADEVIIGNEFEIIFHIYEYNPCVIISHLPRTKYDSSLYTMVKMAYQCLWIAIPTEGFIRPTPEEIKELIGYNKYSDCLVDYYFFWGTGIRDVCVRELLIQKKISTEDRCRVFGYIPYERTVYSKYTSVSNSFVELSKKRKDYKKAILVVLGTMAYEMSIDEWIGQTGTSKRNRVQYEKEKRIVEVYNDYNNKYIDIINALADSYNDYLFIIKAHPAEASVINEKIADTRYKDLIKKDNVTFIDLNDKITLYFDIVDLLIHYGSTTSLEAYINRVPSLCIYDKRDSRYPYYGNALFEINDVNGIIEYMSKDFCFQNDKKVSDAVIFYVNYDENKTYKPTVWLTDAFKDCNSIQMISSSSGNVVNNLLYKSVLKRICCFWLNMIKSLLCGDRDRYSRIRAFMRKYYMNIFRK